MQHRHARKRSRPVQRSLSESHLGTSSGSLAGSDTPSKTYGWGHSATSTAREVLLMLVRTHMQAQAYTRTRRQVDKQASEVDKIKKTNKNNNT